MIHNPHCLHNHIFCKVFCVLENVIDNQNTKISQPYIFENNFPYFFQEFHWFDFPKSIENLLKACFVVVVVVFKKFLNIFMQAVSTLILVIRNNTF